MTAIAAGAAAPISERESWLRHPKGLAYLAGTELFERISFHGMQALLVLYMVDQLLLPGHVEQIVGFATFRGIIEGVTGTLSTQALASQIFGLYIGLVYFTPVLGGWLGDRLLGRRGAVTLGALLMTAGHFCMAFDETFLLALLLLILGAGCLRGNLISQLGNLYQSGDRRRADGFQIYFTMVNIGAFIAPIATGALNEAYGWHYGFGFAGFGMLIGLFVYLSAGRHLPREPRRDRGAPRQPLGREERRTVLYLLALLPLAAAFWIAQAQVWNVYNLWVRDHVDLQIGSWTMPVPWLQAIDSLGVVVLVAPLLLFWRRQGERGSEPADLTKAGIGCLLFAGSVLWLAAADLVAGADGKAPLLWAIAFHFLSAAGWLYFVPVMLALVSKLAPASVNGLMIGVYYLSIFAGSTISGRLGGLYEQVSPAAFWGIHAAIVGGAGVVLLTCSGYLVRGLTPRPALAA